MQHHIIIVQHCIITGKEGQVWKVLNRKQNPDVPNFSGDFLGDFRCLNLVSATSYGYGVLMRFFPGAEFGAERTLWGLSCGEQPFVLVFLVPPYNAPQRSSFDVFSQLASWMLMAPRLVFISQRVCFLQYSFLWWCCRWILRPASWHSGRVH